MDFGATAGVNTSDLAADRWEDPFLYSRQYCLPEASIKGEYEHSKLWPCSVQQSLQQLNARKRAGYAIVKKLILKLPEEQSSVWTVQQSEIKLQLHSQYIVITPFFRLFARKHFATTSLVLKLALEFHLGRTLCPMNLIKLPRPPATPSEHK